VSSVESYLAGGKYMSAPCEPHVNPLVPTAGELDAASLQCSKSTVGSTLKSAQDGPSSRCAPLLHACLLLQLPAGSVDVELLHDATRREARAAT